MGERPQRIEHVVQAVGHDHVVVDGDDHGDDHHGHPDPQGAGQHLHPDPEGPHLGGSDAGGRVSWPGPTWPNWPRAASMKYIGLPTSTAGGRDRVR